MWTIDLQARRLQRSEPEDAAFVFRRWADFHFLIVALTRLRRAAVLAAKVPAIRAQIQTAIRTFDQALPQLKKFRDVAEHVDDYAVDAGRDRSVTRQHLGVATMDLTAPTVTWLGHSLTVPTARAASKTLFRAIQGSKSAIAASP